MSDREAMELARDLVRGSIIEDAASRFISQVLKEAHDSKIKPLRERIKELEDEIKLLSEGATIAHLRGAMDAHANRADDIWAEFKDKWDGEKKFALREVVKFLRGGKGE